MALVRHPFRFAGAVLALLGVAVAPPAAAAPELDQQSREAGLWHFDRLHLDEIHESGITGEGVTIAVINTEVPELAGANIEVKGRWCADYDSGEAQPAESADLDLAQHGTSVVSMISGNGTDGDGGLGARGAAPDAEIWFYAGSPFVEDYAVSCVAQQPEESTTNLQIREPASMLEVTGGEPGFIGEMVWEAEAMAALDAIRSGADIISISSSTDSSPSWEAVVAEAVREGVVIVAATPNPEGAADALFDAPARFNGVVAVNSVDRDAEIISADGVRSDGSFNLAVVAPGVDILTPNSPSEWSPVLSFGNSLATPMVASIVALGLENQPDASAHQILQAMIRTTGSRGFGDPEWSDHRYGYGIVNPKAMLEVDATELPDENPLFVSEPDDPRCTDSATGENPTTVAECLQWANTPVPKDVWPEEGTGEESHSAEGEEEPIEPADPSEGASADFPIVEEEPSSVTIWIAVGGGVLLLVVIVTGIVVAKLARRDR